MQQGNNDMDDNLMTQQQTIKNQIHDNKQQQTT